MPVEEDLVNDGWTEIFRDLMSVVPANKEKDPEITPQEAAEMAEIADFKKMNGIRQRVDDTVKNGVVADLLKPWYRQFCKRPTLSVSLTALFSRQGARLGPYIPAEPDLK